MPTNVRTDPQQPWPTSAVRKERDLEAVESLISLSFPSWQGGTCEAHGAPLLVTSAGAKRSSALSLPSIPHVERSLRVLHTP